MIPDWLAFLLTYLGTGSVSVCLATLRHPTVKRKILLWPFLWPILMVASVVRAVRERVTDASRVADLTARREQRTQDIAFWRAQLATDDPVQQGLAQQMLKDVYEVAEKEPTSERATDALDDWAAASLSMATPECNVCHNEGWTKPLSATRTGFMCPQCAGTGNGLPKLPFCSFCGGTGHWHEHANTPTRQQVKKTLSKGALSPLPPDLRPYTQSYQKVVNMALENLHSQMSRADYGSRKKLDLVIDQTNELISTRPDHLPGISGQYCRSVDQSAVCNELGTLIAHTVTRWAPELAAHYRAELTGDPVDARMADFYRDKSIQYHEIKMTRN